MQLCYFPKTLNLYFFLAAASISIPRPPRPPAPPASLSGAKCAGACRWCATLLGKCMTPPWAISLLFGYRQGLDPFAAQEWEIIFEASFPLPNRTRAQNSFFFLLTGALFRATESGIQTRLLHSPTSPLTKRLSQRDSKVASYHKAGGRGEGRRDRGC